MKLLWKNNLEKLHLGIEKVPLEKCFEYAMEDKYDCAIESLAILTYYFKIKNS